MNTLISIVGVFCLVKKTVMNEFIELKIPKFLMTCGMEFVKMRILKIRKDGDAIDEVDKSAPLPPTYTKELALWKIKDKKAYALMISYVSEEVDI